MSFIRSQYSTYKYTVQCDTESVFVTPQTLSNSHCQCCWTWKQVFRFPAHSQTLEARVNGLVWTCLEPPVAWTDRLAQGQVVLKDLNRQNRAVWRRKWVRGQSLWFLEHTHAHRAPESANFTLTELQGNGHGCSQARSTRWLTLEDNMAFCTTSHTHTHTHSDISNDIFSCTWPWSSFFFGIFTLSCVSARLPSYRQLSVKLGKCHLCLSHSLYSRCVIVCVCARVRLERRANRTSR